MTHLPKKLLLLGTVACALGAAQPAAAQVQPAGTGEPAVHELRSRTPSGSSGPPPAASTATRCASTTTRTTRWSPNPTQNDAPNGASNVWANWSGVRKLQHGGQYGICAQGAYSLPNDSLVLPRRPELVLDGHAARPPRLHDDRPLEAEHVDRRSRAAPRRPRTPRSRSRSASPTTSRGRSRPTSCASSSAARRTSATRTPASSTATTPPARSRAAAASRRRSPARPTSARAPARRPTARCGRA